MEKTNPCQSNFSGNALLVLEKRYFKKNSKGECIEDVDAMFHRIAGNIAHIDLMHDPAADIKLTEADFYELMIQKDFMPNSPTLMNAGNDLQQLSACFVLPVHDSIEGIFESIKNTALIHKSGGGTGFSFSRIRPKNDTVRSTQGVSSGPVSFMMVFDSATEAIKQGGTRRGANMGILRVDHPDIIEFIKSKDKTSRHLTNFNISVAITEDFIEAAKNNLDYDIIHPNSHTVVGRMNAGEVFDLIVNKAWETGDPGIIFIDRINRDNPTPHLGQIESTNPCGEQPLLPYEACNLGSINLHNMLILDNQKYALDWDKFEKVIRRSVHFLDNVIDASRFPLEEITSMVKGNRKIGLGVMGFADMLILMEIPYDSQDALDLAGQIMEFLQRISKNESEKLAEKRGSFPNYPGSIYDIPGGKPMRNATTTTIAPTGTISIIAGCSSGIEPLFALCFTRNVLDGHSLIEINPVFDKIVRQSEFYTEEMMQKINQDGGVQHLDEIPAGWKKILKTAHDIAPEWHVRMQAAFQKSTDNAVSKTVNFSHDAEVDDIRKVYMLAYELGCKGVTVFRDRSLDKQVLNVGIDKNTEAAVSQNPSGEIYPRTRSPLMRGVTRRFKTGCGNIYITLNYDNGNGLFEIFNQIGKAGGCAASQSEAIGRLASLALRSGISPNYIIEQLKGISCHRPTWDQGEKIFSCADAIGKAIEEFINLKNDDQSTLHLKLEMAKKARTKKEIMLIGACPDCGSSLEISEGCITCRACGYSECG